MNVPGCFARQCRQETVCKKHPCFGNDGEVATRCAAHKLDGMQNVVHKRCIQYSICFNYASQNPRYQDHCILCFTYKFPDEPTVRNYKTKERAVGEFVSQQFPTIDLTFDRRIENGCSRRRPDIMTDFGSHVVIIEVDEEKHESYMCETKRDVQLWQDVGERNIVFIRFNPDAYGNVTSCWTLTKNGRCIVKKTKVKEWSRRLESLKERIEFWTQNVPNKFMTREELFYF